MGKDKLKRWAQNKEFAHVFEPELKEIALGATYKVGEWHSVFGNDNPIVLELGCGKGEYTVGQARIFPDKNFLGVDIKGHRFWRGAKTAEEEGLHNVAFLRARIEAIDRYFAEDEISEIWLTFSDPQLKDRREKKRMTGPNFIDMYRKFCPKGADLHVKTDNTFFYHWSLESFEEHGVEVLSKTDDVYGEYLHRQSERKQKVLGIRTYYEEMFAEKGEKIKYVHAKL